MNLRLKRTTHTEIEVQDASVPALMPSEGGKYKIEVKLSGSKSNAFYWTVTDPVVERKHELVSHRYMTTCPWEIGHGFIRFKSKSEAPRAHAQAVRDARACVEGQLEVDALNAEYGDTYVEFYGQDIKAMEKTFETQRTYIEELEAKLDEFRGPDGRLEADKLG